MKKGLSLIEILLGISIGSILIGGGGFLLKKVFQSSSSTLKEQSEAVESQRALNHLERVLHNTALIFPAEGFGAANDQLYRGLAGVDSLALIDDVSECKFEKDPAGKERYSIVRLTTLKHLVVPQRLLTAWNEKDINSVALRLGIPNDNQKGMPLLENGKGDLEILLIDADSIAIRHYIVNNATLDTSKNVLPVDHWSVSVSLGTTFTGVVQNPIPQSFITDSMVYGVTTSVICVNRNGELIEKNMLNKAVQTLLKLPREALRIDGFRLTYANSPAKAQLSKDLFFDFPHRDLAKAQCINVAEVQITVGPTPLPNGNPASITARETHSRMVLLNNFDSRRPATCTGT